MILTKKTVQSSGSNSDREIVIAALRWHAARARRLVVGAEKRRADAVNDLRGFHLQFETSKWLSQARRKEQAALRDLAKACQKQRSHLANVEDADVVIDL